MYHPTVELCCMTYHCILAPHKYNTDSHWYPVSINITDSVPAKVTAVT